MTSVRQLVDHISKDVVVKPTLTDAAPMESRLPEGQITLAVGAKRIHSAVAQMVSPLPGVLGRRDATARTRPMVAALTTKLRRKVPILKGAVARRLCTDAVLTKKLQQEVHILQVVAAKPGIMDVVQMAEWQPEDQTKKDATVIVVLMDAVPMVSLQPMVQIMKDVQHWFTQGQERCVVFIKKLVNVAISRSNGFSTWNMAAAVVSGTVVVMAMITDSTVKRNANKFACCQKE